MVYLNNIAATYFGMGKYAECVNQCDEAIKVGRENRANYKVSKGRTRAHTQSI